MKNVIGVRQAAADRGKRDGVIGYYSKALKRKLNGKNCIILQGSLILHTALLGKLDM